MHDHTHGDGEHDHAQGAATAATPGERMIGEELDPAGRSLADALKVSFRVLGFIIIVLLGAYLASGLFTVKSDQRAVVVRLGQLRGQTAGRPGRVLRSGLHFSWPFPIDRTIIVPVREQSLQIDSFWYFSSASEAGKDYAQLSSDSDSLRPGFGGALMTGDGGFMHVRWECKYSIPADQDRAVLDYLTRVGGLPGEGHPNAIHRVGDPDRQDVLAPARQAVTEAVETASIRVAATLDLETIRRNDRDKFAPVVQALAQKLLDELGAGIRIGVLQCVGHVPPLQTREAFNAVTQAAVARSTRESEAEKEAASIRLQAAGANWQPLTAAIDRYERALRDKDAVAAEGALTEINRLLLDENTGGQARAIIESARGEARQAVAEARTLSDLFHKLLPSYLANPDLTVHWKWTETKQEILSRDSVLKQYAPKTGRGLVLFVNYEGDLLRRLKEAAAKAQDEALRQKQLEQMQSY